MIDITMLYFVIAEYLDIYEDNTVHNFIGGPKGKRKRQSTMGNAEFLTVLLMYPFSGYKNFKMYYLRGVDWNAISHKHMISYNRYIQLLPRYLRHLMVLSKCFKANHTGTFFIDSSEIPVCMMKRMGRNKVFKEIAKLGKSSKGWFYGFKFHIIINENGELVNFAFSKGNVDDRKVVEKLAGGLKGKLYGDKGYICSNLFQTMINKGLKVVTSVRNNMKNKLMRKGTIPLSV